MTVPTLPLPGYWLLAHAILFLATAALVIGAALVGILMGQVVAWGINYWRGE